MEHRRSQPNQLSLWHDTVDDDLAPRPALPNDIDVDVVDRRRRLHRFVDRLLPPPARPDPAGRRARAGVRRVRRVGPQRRLVLGPVRRQPRADRDDARSGRRGRVASARCSTRSTRSVASRSSRGSTATSRRAARSASRRCPRTSSGCRRELRVRASRTGSTTTTTDGSTPGRRERGSASNRASARCSRRTAPRSTRPGLHAGSRGSSNGTARTSTSRRRALAIEPHQVRTTHGTVKAEKVIWATEAFTPMTAPASGGRSPRSTR